MYRLVALSDFNGLYIFAICHRGLNNAIRFMDIIINLLIYYAENSFVGTHREFVRIYQKT